MSSAVRLSLVCLSSLLAAAVLSAAAPQGQRAAAPAALRSEAASEQDWIAGEVSRDILEMASYANGRPATARGVRPQRTSATSYRLPAQAPLRAAVDISLDKDVWSPDAFAGIARAAIDHVPPAALPATSGVHAALLDATPTTIVRVSQQVSKALASNMADPRAHESAALTIATFALRDAAKQFSDVRWSLNRITAHLAMAEALRQGRAPGSDGVIAGAALAVLTNHQARADALIAPLAMSSEDAVVAWSRVLHLRITQDWTSFPARPAEQSLLERLEYFRARRATVSSTLAAADLQRLGAAAPYAEWIRIMEAFPSGVDDGWLESKFALAAELDEAETVSKAVNGRPLDRNLSKDVNARATRTVTDRNVQILPWGAWAEFFNRHFALQIVVSQRYYKDMYGSDATADAARADFRNEFRKLTLFPIASIYWTTGPRGSDADMTYINDAIALGITSPELVTSEPWNFLELGTQYEKVRQGMPSGKDWFIPISPRDPYDAGSRIKYFPAPPTVEETAAVLQEAPHDVRLIVNYVERKYGVHPPRGELARLFGDALTHDLRAIERTAAFSMDDAERRTLYDRECNLSVVECFDRAAELIDAGNELEAAALYERMFAAPEMDSVRRSNTSWWLVDYYLRQQQPERAQLLADLSAKTGSAQGLLTAAWLDETLGHLQDAERRYVDANGRYPGTSRLVGALLGFYYRAATHGHPEYQAKWDAASRSVFPRGLQPVSSAKLPPETGVILTNDSYLSRRGFVQAGDMIVGVNGWLVENLTQYWVIRAFSDDYRVKLTVWRGVKFEPTLTVRALRDIELRSYPVLGYKEK